MRQVCVVGHFGFGKEMLNGQTIKTKIVTTELERQLGADWVTKIDTHGGLRRLPSLIIKLIKQFKQCKNIIMLPAHNGICFLVPVCSYLNMIYNRKLHYVVIGGWLTAFLKNKQDLTKQLKRFHGIYVETSTMKKALEKESFHNVFVMPNFKDIQILKPEELVYTYEQPYKLCTFSRVMKEKGIEDAFQVIRAINEKAGYVVYTFDIYGQIDNNYEETFAELQKSFPVYVTYKGKVPFDKSVEILKNYFALLFPTRFYTEGIPGTIIDAYAAGVPVISSRWESFGDVIDDNVTGVGYEFYNNDELIKILERVAEHPEIILELKKNCLLRAKKYTNEDGIEKLIQVILHS